VVQHGDLPRLERLVRRLSEEVTRRHRLISEKGFASLGEWRDAVGAGEGVDAVEGADVADAAEAVDTVDAIDAVGFRTDRPGTPVPAQMLLLVDGWDAVAAAADSVDHGALTDQLLALLRDGPSAGLRLLATGDRGLLLGRMSGLFAERLVLRLANRADAVLAGLGAGRLPPQQPPGRAVLASHGTEVQICWPGGGPGVGRAAQAGTERHRSDTALPSDLLPLRVEALPLDLDLSDLTHPPHDRAGASATIGVGGDLLVPVGLNADVDGRRWLVAGPSRSGKTTALRTISESLLAGGSRLAVVCERPGPLDELRGRPGVLCCVRPDGIAEVADAWRHDPRLAVIVDDADAAIETPADPVLREIARLVERDQGLVVCAATTATLATQYRGLAVEVARHQTGLLLSPQGPADGDLFGIRAPRSRERVPGRGLLVARGSATEVQVARARPRTAAYP
jgi:S-DNA-T family DNA segregation ATPase FtsK/SpoIIIE